MKTDEPQVRLTDDRFCTGSFEMMNPFTSGRTWAAFLLAVAALGCARGGGSSSIQAVEVGNPEDSRPPKTNKPVPLRLVQVEIQPTQFEEISKINFNVDSVSISDGTLGGTKHPVQQSAGSSSAQLVLSPDAKSVLEFKVPESFLRTRAQINLEFKFASAKPGIVFVGTDQFDIAGHDLPLTLQVDVPEQMTDSQGPIVLSRTLTKATLFEPQTVKTDKGQNSSVSGNDGVDAGVPPPNIDPAPAKPAVYKLRDSSG